MKKTYSIKIRKTGEYLLKTRNGRWFIFLKDKNIENTEYNIGGNKYILAEYGRKSRAEARIKKILEDGKCCDKYGGVISRLSGFDYYDFDIIETPKSEENHKCEESPKHFISVDDALMKLYMRAERTIACDDELAEICVCYLTIKKALEKLK